MDRPLEPAPPFPSGADAAVPARIKSAAARLFQSRGYASVTVDEIVRDVGVTKGGFYHHFESKAELLYELHAEYVAYSVDAFRRVFAATSDPTEQLRAFVYESFRQIDRFQEYVGLLFDERRALPADKADYVEMMKAELRHMLRTVIEAGIDSGDFRQVDSHAASLAIFGMCTWGYLWYRRSDDLTYLELSSIFAEFAVRAVTASSAVERD